MNKKIIVLMFAVFLLGMAMVFAQGQQGPQTPTPEQIAQGAVKCAEYVGGVCKSTVEAGKSTGLFNNISWQRVALFIIFFIAFFKASVGIGDSMKTKKEGSEGQQGPQPPQGGGQ